MLKHFIPIIVAVVLFGSLFLVCGFTSAQPYWPDQAWRVSSPEEQGLDSTRIVAILEHITQQQIDIHSLLIVRHGYLVTEAYWAPYSKETKHPLFSGTKSFTSALLGIALEDGKFRGVEQKVLDFFGNADPGKLDPVKKDITVEHLLTMSSGLKPTPSSPLFSNENPIQFVLDLPMEKKPGEAFAYNSAALHLLSGILRQTTGTDIFAYAQTRLFTPLGISDVTWQTDSKGLHLTATGISMTPRDWAKFGYLYLQNGTWNGKQLISPTWIAQSTQKQIDTTGKMNAAENDGYGYLWWMNGFDGYSAHGFGGQYLFVIPALDVIVVVTAGLPNPQFPIPHELVKTYILPAAQSAEPLKPNPQASQDLKTSIEKLAYQESKSVGSLPDTAKRISGKTFRITQEGSGGYFCKTVALTFTDGAEYTSESFWPDGKLYVLQGGLNNIFRLNAFERNQQPARVALKAYWQDEKTFVEYLKDFSQVDLATHTYTFEGNKLTIDVNSSMGAYSFQAVGEMVE